MRLKKLGSALIVFAALGAVLASSALAAAVTEDVKWYTGAAPGTELTGEESVSVKIASEEGGFFTIVGGTEIVIANKKVSCVECKISNVAGVGAVGTGKLRLEEVTVVRPVNCETATSIQTKPVSFQADWMIGSASYIRFVPTAGEETGFATFELTGAGCPLSTTVIPKGSYFVKTVNATGTQAVSQTVESSKAINTAAGGNLHVGSEAAWIVGATSFSLSGAKAGTAFGTH